MPKFTINQQKAIDTEGKNIIVSAGAGSGKTAVLTARVIRKLKDGIDVNKLLVLTFTNEAANEMKDRIRKAIKNESNLKKQLDYIDSAYITTFDSYSLSLLKKYHYLLNMPKNISIIGASSIDIKKEEYLEEIFKALYEEENPDFLKLIKDFAFKDDLEIKKSILKINNALELKYNKREYLSTYLEKFYQNSYVDTLIDKYLKKVYDIQNEIKDLYEKVTTTEESKKIIQYEEALKELTQASNYEEIRENLDKPLPRIVKNSKEEKERLKQLIASLKELTIYKDPQEIKETYLSTYSYVKIIIYIINKLDDMINEYKETNNSYEFIDISKMAIKIVSENENVKEEIKNYFNEIMIDEYQDTNDLQEMFISKISNNNVYMVGDIKQSIYRFRNANPFIFKEKYDAYSNEKEGIKIDLLKNFRSRGEVLEDINKIFNKIMDDFLGGASYTSSHQMQFGNTLYEEQNDDKTSNNLEIYSYDEKEEKSFSNNEKEAFIIAKDIKKKVKEGYKVIDKKTQKLRGATYNDFCIIMDRGTDFDLYKKIFEYENIPLVAFKDEELTSSYDILILKNLISLIIKIKKYELDQKFKYYFTSISRSYLFSKTDKEIFEIFKNNTFKEQELFKKCKNISDNLDSYSCHELINTLLEDFNFFEKSLTYHDIDNTFIRILNLQDISKSLEMLKFTPYDLEEFLEKMINSKNEIKYKTNTKDETSVKIMNIHKSKGLEFPVCYFSGFYKEFNIKDINSKFIFDNNLGIITPYYKEAVGTLFTKHMAKENYIKEEISEKIRLFYVAVTRAKEKMIFVCPLNNDIYNDEKLVDKNIRLKYRSFLDIVNTVKDEFDINTKTISFENITLTKDYNLFKTDNFNASNEEKIIKKEIKLKTDKINDNKFSKINLNLKTKEELENMEYGTKIHYIFEMEDFLNPSNEYVKKFLKHSVFKNIKASNIYKEYEFIYEIDNNTYSGVIDLMLEYEDHIDIIDYKLSNTKDDNYKKQLYGYRDYIFNKANKPVKTYLYSITKDSLEEI